MDIASLRHRVTLENPGAMVPDGDGGFTTPFTAFATVWASIAPATAKDLERLVAGSVQSSATHVVRIRYLAGVTTLTRVRFGLRSFAITGVMNPDERSVELVLTCEEVVL